MQKTQTPNAEIYCWHLCGIGIQLDHGHLHLYIS